MYVHRSIAGFEDRRVTQLETQQHWLRLTNAQKFSFYTLEKVGYQLLFVRQSDDKCTAVAGQDGQLAVIDEAGEIDFNSNLVLRQSRREDK